LEFVILIAEKLILLLFKYPSNPSEIISTYEQMFKCNNISAILHAGIIEIYEKSLLYTRILHCELTF